MAGILEYECPCCGGKLEFNTGVQTLKCPFCDSEFSLDVLQQYEEDKNENHSDDMTWNTEPGSQWDNGETDGMNVYKCGSCGGQIIADQTLGASKCPYCDNPIVMTGTFSGDLKPDYVIPFKLDKNAAITALSKHLEGKRLLPKVFKEQNHIEEIKGIYVPVWLFDADTDSRFRYKATKKKRWSDNKFDYIETSYYSVVREGKLGFQYVPVDGSSKMDDTLMESIEPFDFKDAVPFKTAYLAGYLADKYDIGSKESIGRANDRIKCTTEQVFRDTVSDYDSVTVESSKVHLTNGEAKYALYPVWLLNTIWNDQRYTFAMNGQTGKFVGDLPIDKGAAFRWFAGILPICVGVVYLILKLIS